MFQKQKVVLWLLSFFCISTPQQNNSLIIINSHCSAHWHCDHASAHTAHSLRCLFPSFYYYSWCICATLFCLCCASWAGWTFSIPCAWWINHIWYLCWSCEKATDLSDGRHMYAFWCVIELAIKQQHKEPDNKVCRKYIWEKKCYSGKKKIIVPHFLCSICFFNKSEYKHNTSNTKIRHLYRILLLHLAQVMEHMSIF